MLRRAKTSVADVDPLDSNCGSAFLRRRQFRELFAVPKNLTIKCPAGRNLILPRVLDSSNLLKIHWGREVDYPVLKIIGIALISERIQGWGKEKKHFEKNPLA